jgi:hypothetical protein
MTTYFDPNTETSAVSTITYTMITEMTELKSLLQQFLDTTDPLSVNVDVSILHTKMSLLNARYIQDNLVPPNSHQENIEHYLLSANQFWADAWTDNFLYTVNTLIVLINTYIIALSS